MSSRPMSSSPRVSQIKSHCSAAQVGTREKMAIGEKATDPPSVSVGTTNQFDLLGG
uniref:Uncharacterized protein n=1 Tax=Triticum urartu TaxID=4572 RepID=A0A8R7THX9_TRIUA